ncbi:hypothetical protein [Mangrovibacterium sp.]|uniref:hypothetical protein n=1 Tax=Mangrovibacterium sp. TaxID=1961364 RepID=UPI0035633A80
MKTTLLLLFVTLPSFVFSQQVIQEKLGSATVSFSNNKLVVSTGKVERTWKVTSSGLVTTDLKNLETGKQWVNSPAIKCDWNYEGLLADSSECKLIQVSSQLGNDEGFTSEYLETVAEFDYPATQTRIKYHIWAYPNAPGLRTQVWIKGKATDSMLGDIPIENNEGIRFQLNSGKKVHSYAAAGVGKIWQSAWVVSPKEIEYQVFGLNKNKLYQLGLSWWDFEGKDRIQKIILTSVDGETTEEILAPTPLPDYRNKKEFPKEIVLDIPAKVLMDGSMRVRIESANNTETIIGELWINEKTDALASDLTFEGDENRIEQLKNAKKEPWILAAYSDCGNEPDEAALAVYGRCDFLPIDATEFKRVYAGYYNDTQHRNTPETPLLKEEEITGSIAKTEKINWASILMVSDQNEGLALVKESHKCVNQRGVETGDFLVSADGIENRGTSLYPKDLSPDEYKWYWSSWTVLYSGNQNDGRAAIKAFDRLRYPVNPELDIYTMANTWGSSRNRLAAKEENVLREIDCQANLGIDIQQIDDGWQDTNWLPSTEWYPTGWGNVVERAKAKNIKLGLWGAAMPITPEALIYNYKHGGFVTYKLDFANLSTHDRIDEIIGKIRNFIQATEHKVRVNWDVTENAPRYGYFWAREYGSVFLENRKTDVPTNVVYVPHLVLRDLWHLSKYANLNKFQGSVQNVAMTDKTLSDAWQHSQAYATAIPLMSTPLFFQETQFLSADAVLQIKSILAAYKTFRNELYECFIYPIGNEPDNKSWSGFQAVHPQKRVGYLTLFRERNNNENSQSIQLLFLEKKRLKITNLLTGNTFIIKTDNKGTAMFKIQKSGDFRLYKYEYLNRK